MQKWNEKLWNRRKFSFDTLLTHAEHWKSKWKQAYKKLNRILLHSGMWSVKLLKQDKKKVWVFSMCVCLRERAREKYTDESSNQKKIIIIIRKTTHNRIMWEHEDLSMYTEIRTHTTSMLHTISIIYIRNVLHIWRYTCDEFICMRRNCRSL